MIPEMRMIIFHLNFKIKIAGPLTISYFCLRAKGNEYEIIHSNLKEM